jgi:hypothetical protein
VNNAGKYNTPEYRTKRKAEIRRNQREYKRLIKERFVKMYGGQCICCGESNFWFLTLDHIHNDGKKKRIGSDNYAEYRRALTKYNPNEFQILCMNCNCAKQWYGSCPHTWGKENGSRKK